MHLAVGCLGKSKVLTRRCITSYRIGHDLPKVEINTVGLCTSTGTSTRVRRRMQIPVLPGVCGECEFDRDCEFPKNSYV